MGNNKVVHWLAMAMMLLVGMVHAFKPANYTTVPDCAVRQHYSLLMKYWVIDIYENVRMVRSCHIRLQFRSHHMSKRVGYNLHMLRQAVSGLPTYMLRSELHHQRAADIEKSARCNVACL